MPRGLPPHGGLSSWIMSNQKHIVLAGGGTAGHVNPLLAVAHVIRELEPEADIAVVGTAVGLERDLVPQAGFELETIEKVPFPRRPNKAALQFPAKWKAEKAKVRDILTRHQAQVVVGFGGYTSAPVYAAAHSMGIPIAIHEQNARAGMAQQAGRALGVHDRCRIRPARTETTQGRRSRTRGPAASSGNRTIGVRSGT